MNINVEKTVRPSPIAQIAEETITGEPFVLFTTSPIKKPSRRIVDTISAVYRTVDAKSACELYIASRKINSASIAKAEYLA